MGSIWPKGMWNIIYVLWPASKDCAAREHRSGSLQIATWNPVFFSGVVVWMVLGNIKGYLWHIRRCITEEGICYQHLLPGLYWWWHYRSVGRAVLSGDRLVHQPGSPLLCSRGSWSLLTLNALPKHMFGTLLHQRHRQAFHTLCWNSTVLQV